MIRISRQDARRAAELMRARMTYMGSIQMEDMTRINNLLEALCSSDEVTFGDPAKAPTKPPKPKSKPPTPEQI